MLVRIEDVCDIFNNHWPFNVVMEDMQDGWMAPISTQPDPNGNMKYFPKSPGEFVPISLFNGNLVDIFEDKPYKIPTFKDLFLKYKTPAAAMTLLDIGLEASSDNYGPIVAPVVDESEFFLQMQFSVKAKHKELVTRMIEVINETI